MKSRRFVSTVLSVVLLATQLAMPLQRAFAAPATVAPLMGEAARPPTNETLLTAAPALAGAGALPEQGGASSTPRMLGPIREPPEIQAAGPQALASLPIGVGYSNYGQQQRDTDNPQNHPGHAFAGSVNLLNGNYFLTVGDLFLPGRGLSLQLARSYNSLAAAEGRQGAFGYGWTHSYETRVISETAGASLTVQEGDGALHEYLLQGPCPDGSGDLCYQAPDGFHRELRDMVGGNFLLTHKNGTFQVFDDLGRLIEIQDRHGNEIQLRYEDGLACPPGLHVPPNALCQVLDPTARRSLVFTYSEMPGPPRILSVSESFDGVIDATRAVAYAYDGLGNLVDAAYPEEPAGTLNYAYADPLHPHRLTSYNDPRQPAGARTVQNIAYDAMDRVVTTTMHVDSFFDVFYAIEYDLTPSQSDPSQGAVWAVRITDGEGQISQVEYDPYGNVTYEGDWFPDYGWWWGKWWWWYPDRPWDLWRKVDANDHATVYAYDGFGNTTVITNALGAVQRFLWEPPAYASEPSTPTYGNVLTTTNSLGVTTLYEYNYLDNVVFERKAEGTPEQVETVYQSDAYGQLVLEFAASAGQQTVYAYDDWGNLTTVTDTLGAATTYVYDDYGRPTAGIDPSGAETVYEYDAADRLLSVTDPEGGKTLYQYSADGRDNLVQLTNANGTITAYVYDTLDRLVSETNGVGETTSYVYDNANRLVQRTDTEDRQTRYGYDAKSRMRRAESYAAGATDPYQVNRYAYDGAGNLIWMENVDVRLAYAYDAIDQRTEIAMWTPSWGMTKTLQLGREPEAGNLTDILGPDGYTVSYAYDDLNRVVSVTDPESQATTYAYDPAGRPATIRYGEGVTATLGHDPLNRLHSLTVDLLGGETLTYTYDYDPLGNMMSEVDLGETYAYAYDAVGRVTTAGGGAEGEISYSYDPVGNRISAGNADASTSFTYDSVNRLTQAGDATLGYDGMGARTSLQRTVPTVASGAVGSVPSLGGLDPAATASTVAYAYDNDMRLTQVADGTQLTRFLYDPLGNLIGYVDAGGATHYYLRDGEDIYMEFDATGAIVATYTLGAQGVLSMWRDGVPYLFLYDGIGRVRHVVDMVTWQIVLRYGRDLLAPGTGLVDFYNPIRMRGAWWFPGVTLVTYGGGVFWDPVYGVFLAKAWTWLYWPFGPFHPWRPIFRFWPWPWPWPRPWGWAWPQPWPFLWPWPGAWVRPWLIWPVWPWGLRFWWPWWYWCAWWGWVWWGRWWCWHPWWWWGKWWWWPWWHRWWWWPYWWWPWWWWSSCWWWPHHWWWWIWWPTGWWFWWPGHFWWCWWWWWPWPWWWWPWAWPWAIGPPPDYGDAPDPPYVSLARNNGAAHGIWWYEWLGASRDGEWDSRQVDRDLYDDGVNADPLAETLTFTPHVANPVWPARYGPFTQLHVHGWIDWNQDGDWDDAGEALVNWSGYPGGGSWPVGQPSWAVTQPFNVPTAVFANSDLVHLWLRFRLDYAADWQRTTGYTRFGEVEDHRLTLLRAHQPVWDGLAWPLNASPVITYTAVVSGVNVAIVPTLPITPVWTTTARAATDQTGNRLEIQHAPFTVGQMYTITLSGGQTVPPGGTVLPTSFTLTAAPLYIYLPLVAKEAGP